MFLEVVMPTYNGEKYLAQQVESIYGQTVRPDRLVIRDDGSTDGTICLIKALQQRYGEWINQLEGSEHLGCCASVSILLEAAQARYVALADQDDIWHPDKLEKSLLLLCELEKIHGVDMPLLIHGDLRLVDAEGKSTGHTFLAYQRLDPRRTSPVDLAFTNVVTGCTCLFNRALLGKALPIPVEAEMHDWWMALVASAFGYIGFLSNPYIDYRQHDQNLLGARGLGWRYWLSRVNSLLIGKRDKRRVLGVLRQLEVFCIRYGFELSDLVALLRLPIAKRWLACLFLSSNSLPSRHGLLRTGIFYFRLLTMPAQFFEASRDLKI
jgi:glycosyltransferase involved in cell wall biosynthesis